MKYVAFVLLVVFSYGSAWDSGMVNGLVLDSNGSPVIGASVIIDGSDIGAMTDVNGEYLLYNLDPGVISLTARMVGKASQTIRAGCR